MRATAIFLVTALFIGGGSRAGETIDAADFGLRDLAACADATPAFRRAIEACRERGASGLHIPPGEWSLYPDYAFERRMAVANNDRGIKRVVFLLEGMNDFTIEGDGARLLCHGEMIPVSVDDSQNVRLSGFSIDWNRPFYFQGEVVARHEELNAFDLKVHEEVCCEVRGSRLVFRGKPPFSPNAWKEWAPPPTERKAWEHNLQWNVWFNGHTRHPLPGEHLWALEPDPRVEEVEPGVVRVFDALRHLPEVGWVLVVKGMGSPNRTSPAIRLARSQGIEIDGVTLHQSGGMGVIAQRCDGVTIRGLRVALPEGKGRLVSTSADATHFNGCRGEIVIEDSFFENMLDDATNVHGCFVRVEAVVEPSTVVCRLVHSQQRGLVFAEAGDRVAFVESEALQPRGEAAVTGVRVLNDDLFELTVDRLPGEVAGPGYGLYNLSWQADLTMRRCTVRNNRGRSMLVATRGDVLIEENTFERSTLAGIQFEGDNVFWWESGPTRDVLIRNNTFIDVMGQVLRFIPHIDPKADPDAVYHGGVVFEGNTINTFHRRLVQGKAIDGLVIRDNRFLKTDYLYEPVDNTPSFHFESGRNLVMTGNRYDAGPPLGVRWDTPAARPRMSDNDSISSEKN